MPKAEETQVYLELTQYSLHALRAVGGVVEAGGECALENKASLEALLDAVAPSRKTDGISAIATVWPASSQWYLSTDTEAMLDRTEDSLKAIAASKQRDPAAPLAYAVCNATDGAKVSADGMDKWILAFSPLESLENVSKGLMDLKVDPQDVKPAGFAGVAAVAAALRLEGTGATVALWDIGSEASNLVLVTAKGVEGAVACGVGMEGIFEAVQNALKLKFRGAGARLFFSDGYDFTEPGPKVGAIVGPVVKEALAGLPAPVDPPRLACMGLTGKQAWFIREVAAAAGLSPWEPDIPKLAAELGLTFAEDTVKASFTATSAGLLGLIGMRIASREAWNADWVEAEGHAEEPPAPPPVEAEPEPPPAREPEPFRTSAPPARPKPSLSAETQSGPGGALSARPRPSVAPRTGTVPPMPLPTSKAPGPRPPPAASPPAHPQMRPPSTPAPSAPPDFPSRSPAAPSFPSAGPSAPKFPTHGSPAPSFPSPGAPAPSFPTPGAGGRQPSFSNPGFPMPGTPTTPPLPAMAPPPGPSAPVSGANVNAPAGETPPPRAVTALPFEAAKMKGIPGGATAAPFKAALADVPPPPPPKSRVGFFIGIGVAGALVFAGIAVVVEARLDRIRAHDLEQQEALAAQLKEQDLERQEKMAKEQAEADRKELEIEVAAAKKQAEEDTRRSIAAQAEADRVAKLPGTILLATTPAGASVSIDGGAPLTSPVSAAGIAPGIHKVRITLAAHDPVDLDADLKGGSTLDLGSVALQPSFGELDLTSSPDGLEFAVRTAADASAKPVHTGTTPTSFDDIVHGDYVITFTRPGCPDHNEKASVEKGAKTAVTTVYVDGSLELTSDPSGANVNKDGTFLGTTPLTLHDLTPKVAQFVLTLPGYDSTPVSCQIPEGQTLKYSAQLLRRDRIFDASEVKTPPVKISAPAPVLSSGQRKLGGDIVISFVVTRDGMVSDVEIVRASDDDIARRCKAAVEQWKYGPATAPDDRTVDSRVEVPFKFPAGSP
jgi:TonB family protein